jgi:uncharacterized membrane protein
MNAVVRLILVVLITVIASSAAIDLIGTGTPWLSVGLAAIAAVIVCDRPTSAALCAGLAMAAIEGLVVIHGQRDPAQAGLYVAIAALLAAAFALTAGSHADNSATSQAQGHPVKPVMTSEEVSDED